MSGLSLGAIGILLHYYYSPEEHPDCRDNPPHWRISIDDLMQKGLLTYREQPSQFGATYQTTERAMVYVEAIRSLPLPEQQWLMPEGKE